MSTVNPRDKQERHDVNHDDDDDDMEFISFPTREVSGQEETEDGKAKESPRRRRTPSWRLI